MKRDNKEVLYFACYINVGNLPSDLVGEYLRNVSEKLVKKDDEEERYKERYFIIPVRHESRIDLLYPFDEESKQMLQDNYIRFEEAIKNIQIDSNRTKESHDSHEEERK